MKVKNFLITILAMSVLVLSCSMNTFATSQHDNGDRAVTFIIGTDIGLQPFATRHYYRFGETYTTYGSLAVGTVQYTKHQSASWCVNWSGANFGTLTVQNAHSVDFYDSNGRKISTASLTRDRDMIFDPKWIGYEAATGTDYITINTGASSAKAVFAVFCPESVYGYSQYVAEVHCNCDN